MRKLLYPQLRNGLVGAWCPSIERSRSTLLMDHSGFGNNGTLTLMDPSTDWVASDGKIALDFDGSDDFVDLPIHFAEFSNVPFSFTAWAKPTNSSGYRRLITRENHILFGTYSGEFLFGLGDYTWVSLTTFGSDAALTNGVWYSLVASYSGTAVTGYVNGVNVGTITSVCKAYPAENRPIYIGKHSSQYWQGQADDIRVYNRALTASDAKLLAQRRGIAYETYRVPVVRGAAAGGVTVTPTTATLALATFAPTVSTPRSVTPTTATLTLSTFAPTVSTPQLVTPTTQSLTLSTFAPTVTATANVVVTPTPASLSLATFGPTVTAGGSVTVTPTTASLSLSTFAPTVSTPRLVTPTTATLSLTEFAPAVTVSGTVTPTPASLSLATFAPTVSATANITATPTTLALTLTEYAPTISVGGTVTSLTIDFTGSGVASANTAVAVNAGALASTDSDGPLAVNSNRN